MINLIQKWATGRNVLIFLAIDFIFMLGIMPYLGEQMNQFTPGFQPLDITIPSYTPAHAHQTIAKLSDEGRAYYRSIELGVDLVYPLIYGIAFALLITYLLAKVSLPKSKIRWLALLPLIGMLFDYAENLSIVSLIDHFPQQSDGMAQLAAYCSLGKWSFIFATFALVLIGLLAWAWKKKITVPPG